MTASESGIDETPKEHEQPAVATPLFIASLDVRWRDLDAFNHVNNSSYLTYLEEARLQWLQDVPDWFSDTCMPVLVASTINYRQPIAWPAHLRIVLSCERMGGSSITIGHRITDAADHSRLYSDGNVTMVWMNPHAGKSIALPASIRHEVTRHAQSA
ncbi:MAG: thioesterase family protein [Rhodanobacter sp.]